MDVFYHILRMFINWHITEDYMQGELKSKYEDLLKKLVYLMDCL